ncbi:MAG: amidohydrolase family protein [Desulfobacterales bacterium]|nr:MAG: amidohydrolase family protein [Desulfobacterales bacterium]
MVNTINNNNNMLKPNLSASIIDAHAHCGIQDQFPSQSFENYYAHVAGTGIQKVVMFSPVMEIYDRYDPNFQDNTEWQLRRKNSNEYLLTVGNRQLTVIPYFFIWNDFAVEQMSSKHKGIKWHRHPGEPSYHYEDPRCQMAIDEIRQRNMPVVFEEEFDNTIRFIHEIAVGVNVIIPHLGLLNGGYDAIERNGIWGSPQVYTDTSLAPRHVVIDYINRYGSERILFGSDFPFGDPKSELSKLFSLRIPGDKKDMILGQNLERLLAESHHQQ